MSALTEAERWAAQVAVWEEAIGASAESGRPAQASTPWLQLYGQGSWHDPACIVGDHSGLAVLRDLIDVALGGGESHGQAFAYDGEGYDLLVLPRPYSNAPSECHYQDVASMGGGEWNMPAVVWKALIARRDAEAQSRAGSRPMNIVEPVDFYNLYAQRHFGASADWRWFYLRGKVIGGREIFCIEGAVCEAKFKSGPRVGKTNWAKMDRTTRLNISVPREVFESFRLNWEAETGSCQRCFGSGLKSAGWSVEKGNLTAPCKHAAEANQ